MEVPDELLESWFSEGEGDRASTGSSTNKTKRETNASLISIFLRCNLVTLLFLCTKFFRGREACLSQYM